ncbi:MAG TPA: AraC family transcriptional regulator [Panacibacter sp.]|nr:AraC family transcriptional regulator [Panacibacter sp.]HNP44477.1 AraC family transcriptional regulator [Panacibacter sp.]
MIKIEYNLTSYDDICRYFAKCLKLKCNNNVAHFTPDKGVGYFKSYNLQNGLQLLIYDCTTYESILFHRSKSEKEFYVLRLDESTEKESTSKSSVFFAKTNQEWFYMLTANTTMRQVSILMSKAWLENYFDNELAGELLTNYITVKSPLLFYELMDSEYKRLMNDVVKAGNAARFEQMIYQNRIACIVERFFTRLYKTTERNNSNLKISSREMKRIKEAEDILLKDFSQQPPAIAQLARIAAMSPSKLKILFKEVFGLPVNQYYQKHRMNKAKAMLLSKRYSVKETAFNLGFPSVSSFNKAFYKTFEQLPAEISSQLSK